MIDRARERARRRRWRYLVVAAIVLVASGVIAVAVEQRPTSRGGSHPRITVVGPEQRQALLERRALQQENEAIRLHLIAVRQREGHSRGG